MRRLLTLLLALVALPALAQPALTVTKSGSDVVLTWAAGTGPFTVLRSDDPTLTVRTVTLSGTTSPVTDTGAKTDGARVHFYVISEAAKPTVAITTPAPGFAVTTPCICATGTSTGATAVYCDSTTATGTATWTDCPDTTGVPLAVQADPRTGNALVVTAAASDANGNWNYTTVSGSYTGTITNRVPCRARTQGM